jgi:hypothetical protein
MQRCTPNFCQRCQKYTIEKGQLLAKYCWEKRLSTSRKLKRVPCLLPCTSINSKWIKYLNIRYETLKLVHERARNTLDTIDIGKDFLSKTQVAEQLRERIDKWNYMKFKSFCTTKEMVSTFNGPPTEWEKIFALYTLHKGLITRIYRDLWKLNSPKINAPVKKCATELNRSF